MTSTSKYGFQTRQEKESADQSSAADASARRAHLRQILDTTVQNIGPVVRATLVDYYRGQGLGTIDFTGDEQVALFKEEPGSRAYTWKAWSWKKTGTHTEYRTDGAHSLDEHTAYTITVSAMVAGDGLPLLNVGEYAISKLVGKKPIVASSFALDVPASLRDLLKERTGVRVVDRNEYVRALDKLG